METIGHKVCTRHRLCHLTCSQHDELRGRDRRRPSPEAVAFLAGHPIIGELSPTNRPKGASGMREVACRVGVRVIEVENSTEQGGCRTRTVTPCSVGPLVMPQMIAAWQRLTS